MANEGTNQITKQQINQMTVALRYQTGNINTWQKKTKRGSWPRFVFFELLDELFVSDNAHLGHAESLRRCHHHRYRFVLHQFIRAHMYFGLLGLGNDFLD